MEIDDIGAFTARLKNAVYEIMQDDLMHETKKTMIHNIIDLVYDVYTPDSYVRRKNHLGGLLDPAVMKHTVNAFANVYTLEVGDYSYDNYTKRYIQPIVESGRGYQWKESRIAKMRPPMARPFMAATEFDMDEKKVSWVLKNGLEKRGIEATNG